MNMHWPQVVLVLWMLYALAYSAANNGKPAPFGINFNITLTRHIALTLLLWCGGFFS